MAVSRLTYMRTQLWDVRASDPLKLIALYRGMVGLSELDQLPASVTFAQMIEAILDRQETRHFSVRATDTAR